VPQAQEPHELIHEATREFATERGVGQHVGDLFPDQSHNLLYRALAIVAFVLKEFDDASRAVLIDESPLPVVNEIEDILLWC
jgi:hypothetical protein